MHARSWLLGLILVVGCGSEDGSPDAMPADAGTSDGASPGDGGSIDSAIVPSDGGVADTSVDAPREPICGDGISEGDEECDDGEDNADDASCKSDCTLQVCGDGATGLEEACDDGNDVEDDGCTSDCERTIDRLWATPVMNAEDLALDSSGAPLVAGGWTTTGGEATRFTKLDTDGAVDWTDFNYEAGRFGGVTIDAADDIYVVGTSGDDARVAKFTDLGSNIWARSENDTGTQFGYDIAVAPDGSIFITGLHSAGSTRDLFLRRLNVSGVEVWDLEYHEDLESAAALALTADGDPIAVGWSTAAGMGFDLFILSHAADGSDVNWTATYDGPESYYDAAEDVAILPSGEMFVVGGTNVDNTSLDILVTKYDAAGSLVWERVIAGDLGERDEATGVALTPTGDPVIVGTTTLGGEAHTWLARYHGDGAARWAAAIPGGGGLAVAVDAAGFIYVLSEGVLRKYAEPAP